MAATHGTGVQISYDSFLYTFSIKNSTVLYSDKVLLIIYNYNNIKWKDGNSCYAY